MDTIGLITSQSWVNSVSEKAQAVGSSTLDHIKNFDYGKLFMGSIFTVGTVFYADFAVAFIALGGWYIAVGGLMALVAIGMFGFGCSIVFDGRGWFNGRDLF